MTDWRTWRAKNHDIQVIDRIGPKQYRVNGHRGRDYEVDLGDYSCSCPDWKKREPNGGCKHIRAVYFAVDTGEQSPPRGNVHQQARSSSPDASAYPDDWDTRRRKVYRRDEWTCQNCGKKGGPKGETQLEAHHIVPVGVGGNHSLSNLVTLCHACHTMVHGQPNTNPGPSIAKQESVTSTTSSNTSDASPSTTTLEQEESDDTDIPEPIGDELLARDPTNALPAWSQSRPEYAPEQAPGAIGSRVGYDDPGESDSLERTSDADYFDSPTSPVEDETSRESTSSECSTTPTTDSASVTSEPSNDSSSKNSSQRSQSEEPEVSSATTTDESEENSLGVVLSARFLVVFLLWILIEGLLLALTWSPLNFGLRLIFICLIFQWSSSTIRVPN
ncbi:HNH endonuclease [Halorussus salinisoli]|uniref:HNH endonuclease n=1 Tax=Halorussus salinisoli TaxID=2558242 RepID=UPI002A918804|nr:HNH endonuclease [Halorussus salinisoli]